METSNECALPLKVLQLSYPITRSYELTLMIIGILLSYMLYGMQISIFTKFVRAANQSAEREMQILLIILSCFRIVMLQYLILGAIWDNTYYTIEFCATTEFTYFNYELYTFMGDLTVWMLNIITFFVATNWLWDIRLSNAAQTHEFIPTVVLLVFSLYSLLSFYFIIVAAIEGCVIGFKAILLGIQSVGVFAFLVYSNYKYYKNNVQQQQMIMKFSLGVFILGTFLRCIFYLSIPQIIINPFIDMSPNITCHQIFHHNLWGLIQFTYYLICDFTPRVLFVYIFKLHTFEQ